jgi:hypothetical protein
MHGATIKGIKVQFSTTSQPEITHTGRNVYTQEEWQDYFRRFRKIAKSDN